MNMFTFFVYFVIGYLLYQLVSPMFNEEGSNKKYWLGPLIITIWPAAAIIMIIAAFLMYRDKVKNK